MNNDLENIQPMPPDVIYSWKKGLLYFKVERNFLPDGQSETVALIPRYIPDAEWIAKQCVRGLKWGELLDR